MIHTDDKPVEVLISESEEIAEMAGLKYVTDSIPGFQRRKNGKGFVYFDKAGTKVTEERHLKRFESLVIPPAWTDVWICPTANGHIQATGRDIKGRKQYRYHPKWNDISNDNKFSKIVLFGERLPEIRERIEEDFKKRSLIKEKVLALIVKLLEETMIRVGNAEYALQNDSYGLTTLKNHHLEEDGNILQLVFKGKSGKHWNVKIKDRRIISAIKKCQELPGQELFQYVDETGNIQTIDSSDVNNYLREITNEDYTAKDFRTWTGTVKTAAELYKQGKAISERESKKKIAFAVKQVARSLINTPAICRKYYIHPAILNAYENETLFEEMAKYDINSLPEIETAVLKILKKNI